MKNNTIKVVEFRGTYGSVVCAEVPYISRNRSAEDDKRSIEEWIETCSMAIMKNKKRKGK